MAESYKYKRSRKPISLKDAQLRLTDCIKELERVILDDTYDSKVMQMKMQAIYCMSNAISRLSAITENVEIIERLEALEAKQLKRVS